MEAFDGFKRKAVVLIPSHDDLRKRNSEKRHKDGGFDLPLGDLLDMKSKSAFNQPHSPQPATDFCSYKNQFYLLNYCFPIH